MRRNGKIGTKWVNYWITDSDFLIYHVFTKRKLIDIVLFQVQYTKTLKLPSV